MTFVSPEHSPASMYSIPSPSSSPSSSQPLSARFKLLVDPVSVPATSGKRKTHLSPQRHDRPSIPTNRVTEQSTPHPHIPHSSIKPSLQSRNRDRQILDHVLVPSAPYKIQRRSVSTLQEIISANTLVS